jgi:hypothetical protein
MEYLGLHNKPKAAVYLGQKLTRPKEEEEEEELFSNQHGVICLYNLARLQKGVQILGRIFKIFLKMTKGDLGASGNNPTEIWFFKYLVFRKSVDKIQVLIISD